MENCRDKLIQGLDCLSLQINEASLESMLSFIKLICKWNKAYNLTAVRDPEQMVSLHILDSLTILPYIKTPLVADIGAGAGLPGIPLAICMPECRFVLVDSNSKKTRFMQQAMLELQVKNLEIVHSRVELFKPECLFSTVVTRAYASLAEIVKQTGRLLADDGLLLAMKGQQPEQELAELTTAYKVIPLNVPGIAAHRCLISMEKG